MVDSPLMILQCDQCGFQSDVDAVQPPVFTLENSLFRRRAYCPKCAVQRGKTGPRRSAGWLAAGALAGWLLWWLFPGNFFSNSIFVFLLGLGITIPLMVMHEMAHAATAYLTGLRVFGVYLGLGKTLYQMRLGNTRWEIKSYLFGGATLLSGPPMPWFRVRLFLSILAGPSVHLLLLIPNLMAWRVGEMAVLPNEWARTALWVFFVTNLMIFAGNVYPRKEYSPFAGPVGTDGWNLLQLLIGRPEHLKERHVSYYAGEGLGSSAVVEFVWRRPGPPGVLAALRSGF